jgi:hypothetical protein
MATVTKKCVIHELVLRINLEEAQVLLSILNKIGGPVKQYPRAVADNIKEALEGCGIEAAALECEGNLNAIYFK